MLVWSFINFRRVRDSSGRDGVEVIGGPNPECFRRVSSELSGAGWSVVHLASVGGWDQQHPDDIAADEAFRAFRLWNSEVVADMSLGVAGFDGVDWDIEGADALKSSSNTISVSVLDLIGGFASLAKNHGYFSTLSAPESYLDPFSSAFDRRLTHTYPEWEEAGVDFARHGRNCLAYVVAAYGEAFDLVSLQIYESYSHADFAINMRGLDAGAYLAQYMHRLSRGWKVCTALEDRQTDRQTDRGELMCWVCSSSPMSNSTRAACLMCLPALLTICPPPLSPALFPAYCTG